MRTTATRFAVTLLFLAWCACAGPLSGAPQEMQDAVGQFKKDNPRWKAVWTKENSRLRLSGPGLSNLELTPLPDLAAEQSALTTNFDKVVKRYSRELGVLGLEAKFTNGSRAGNVWFLRGSLGREGVPVDGRVDCGISTTGKVMLMSSQVPPGAAVLTPLVPTHDAKRAAAAAVQAAGLQGTQDDRRVTKDAIPVIWWDADAVNPPPPRLAYRIFIEPRPAQDQAGGTYVIDAQTLELLKFDAGEHHIANEVFGARHRSVPSPSVVAVPTARPRRTPATSASRAGTLVRAWVRTGLGANGATTLEAMPCVDVEWTPAGGQPQTARTDENGQLNVNVAANDPWSTRLTGRLMSVQPSNPFQTVAVAAVDGSVTLEIVDPPGDSLQLERATTAWWIDRGHRHVVGVVGELPAFDNLEWLACVLDANAPGKAKFVAPNSLYFGRAGNGFPSWAFDTIILHEWAHALDHACGGIHQDELGEAWADIVAMFCTGQSQIGLGFDGGGAMRDGTQPRAPSAGGHHHAGEPLVGFAWQVRSRLIAADPLNGARWADSLFLGMVGGDPFDMSEFVRRVYLADDDDAEPATASPNQVVLDECAKMHGLSPDS